MDISGIPLGLAALSLARFILGKLISCYAMVSDVLGIVASVVWILFILMYAYKLRYYFGEVRAGIIAQFVFPLLH